MEHPDYSSLIPFIFYVTYNNQPIISNLPKEQQSTSVLMDSTRTSWQQLGKQPRILVFCLLKRIISNVIQNSKDSVAVRTDIADLWSIGVTVINLGELRTYRISLFLYDMLASHRWVMNIHSNKVFPDGWKKWIYLMLWRGKYKDLIPWYILIKYQTFMYSCIFYYFNAYACLKHSTLGSVSLVFCLFVCFF